MKLNLIVLVIASLISGLCHAECRQESAVANDFMAEYIRYNNDVLNQKTTQTAAQWIQHNENVTGDFKKSYQELVARAEKQDPELGLDFDPILNAQDYPEQGFEIAQCEENLVTLVGKGKEWQNFKVAVEILNTERGWLINGAGVINIPKNKQAKIK